MTVLPRLRFVLFQVGSLLFESVRVRQSSLDRLHISIHQDMPNL